MKSLGPKPSFVMLCAATPVLLGVSIFGFRGSSRAAAFGVCALAAAVLPLVRTRAKGAAGLPIPDNSGDHDEVFWEAEVWSRPGKPLTFRLTSISGNAEETLGQRADARLAGWPSHVAAEDRERVLKTCQSALKQGQETFRLEYRVSNAEGQPIWIEDCVQVLRAWGGKPRKLRGRMVNVTKQKRAAEILRQSQKMEEVGRLVGGVVHDFNNLLTVIGGHADLVLMSMDPMDPRRPSLEEIKRAGDRATTLARQLLSFSRRHAPSLELLDLGTVVGGLGKVLRRLIREDIELVTLAQPGHGHVLADVGEVEQVIINLVVNARDAMPIGGRLAIETGAADVDRTRTGGAIPSGRYITLAVADTGCGMDAATRKRIFEPFFTTKEPGKGTGLGLVTVQEIVRERQGYIEVESELGKGSQFRVYLPRTDSAAAPCPASAEMAGPRPGSETILLVEDEDNVRAMAQQLLSGYGYQVLEAASGEEAVQLMERHTGDVHLLLTDVVMPRMNGHDVGKMLRDRHPGLKVLYMSGYSRNEMAQHVLLDREAPFIQKPFTPQMMAESVRRALDGELEPAFRVLGRESCFVESPNARPN